MLKTSDVGLSEKEVNKRIFKFGKNTLPEEKKTTAFTIIFNQVKSPLVFILFLASIVSAALGHWLDALVILAVVIFNSIIGFFQEYKASQAIAQLKKIVSYQALVIRGGAKIMIDASSIVPGDIVVLEPGMKVPADCRLIKINDLQMVEAALTGESEPADKKLRILSIQTVISDRDNMVFMGTVVARGKGLAVVCATGGATEIGKIAEMVKETEEEQTPLQESINRLAIFLSWLAVTVCVILFIAGVLAGRDKLEMFLVSVAIAVAAIPEGLAIALTVILVIGMKKILKQKSLVRKLIAAETLGGTTVICSDKTGTLTEGKMEVAKLILPGHEIFLEKKKIEISDKSTLAFKIAVLCNDSFIQKNGKEELLVGDSTEQALLRAGIKVGINPEKLQSGFSRLDEVPFSSESMFMATLNKGFLADQMTLLVKGAPEVVLSRCTNILVDSQIKSINSQDSLVWKKRIAQLTARGYRTLAVAYKEVAKDGKVKIKDRVKDLVFVGIFILRDPLRADARETIEICRRAGIRPILITGDHRLTAVRIAQDVGIEANDKTALEGIDLDKMDEKSLIKVVSRINVYARVEPRHKIRIVEALRDRGEVVAMTGDGVNDAPAIKAADIGIALGSGTDVAKETADLILLDDNFRTIVDAVRGGRVILDNLRKVLVYLLSSTVTEMFLIGASIVFGLPLPLIAIQILWVNIVEDAFPVFALTTDPEEKGIMSERPRGRDKSLVDRKMKSIIISMSVLNNLFLFSIFYFFLHFRVYSLDEIRTVVFVGLASGSLFYVFACRSLRYPIWKYNPFANGYVNLSVVVGFCLMALAVYWSPLQLVLKTVPLHFELWLILLAFGVLALLCIEMVKYFFISKNNGKKI